MSMEESKVYVGNLPFSITEDELREEFDGYGKIVHVNMIHDHDSNRFRGFAFIEYEHNAEATKAIENQNSKEWKGRNMVCNMARSRTGAGGGGGGGRRVGYRSGGDGGGSGGFRSGGGDDGGSGGGFRSGGGGGGRGRGRGRGGYSSSGGGYRGGEDCARDTGTYSSGGGGGDSGSGSFGTYEESV